MKLLVYTAVWKRPEITEICFMGIRRLNLPALAVISEVDMIPLCEKYGIEWVMAENSPLGTKKNAGLARAREMDFDFLMEIGSDDLILNELIDQYQKFFVKYDFFGVCDAAYINGETLECRREISGTPYGAGRVISRKALELVDFNLWPRANRGLDKYSLNNLYNKGIKYWQIPPIAYPLVIDIKSPVNLWKFSKTRGAPYDIEEIYSRLTNEEINAIRCLPQVYKLESLIER